MAEAASSSGSGDASKGGRGLDPPTRARLTGVFSQHPEVAAVYLFGSFARGVAREDSDLDLGVVGAPGVEVDSLRLQEGLVRAGIENADLALLDDAPPVLRFEAVHHNQPVYRAPGFDHGSYFTRALNEYFDLEPLLAQQREAYRRRILGG